MKMPFGIRSWPGFPDEQMEAPAAIRTNVSLDIEEQRARLPGLEGNSARLLSQKQVVTTLVCPATNRFR